MKRSFEPFWWSLFGAGGALSALFLPILLLIFFIAIPLDLIRSPSFETVSEILEMWWLKLILTGVISLSMFHWAHRFRFTLEEGLQLHRWDRIIAVICYGTAIITTLLSLIFLY